MKRVIVKLSEEERQAVIKELPIYRNIKKSYRKSLGIRVIKKYI